MAARKGCCIGGCLMKILITIVIIVVLIGGALWWVSNQTPDELGFADTDFGGTTLREMGLAEMKIKDLISVIRNLMKPDETQIVTNPYDLEEDKEGADTNTIAAGIPMDGEDPDYMFLLGDEPLTTEIPLLLEYTDTEIAYIMDTIIGYSEEYDEDVEVIRDMNASLVQVEINKASISTVEMMLAVDISSIKEDIPMGGGLLPDRIYLNSVNKLEVDSSGIISTESQNIEVNGMTDETSTAVINALLSAVDEDNEEDPVEFFNDAFGAVFKKVVNNIGYVGVADLDTSDQVIELTIEYGEDGIEDNVITLITREEE
ncbi:MAG: hypothetical protein ACOCWI_03865 [Bacillota bacterium]